MKYLIAEGIVSIEHSYEDDEDEIFIDKIDIGSILGDLCMSIEKAEGKKVKVIAEVSK